MPTKVFGSNPLTSADVNTYLMGQVIVKCTSGTRPTSPSVGDVIFETDTFDIRYFTGTAWELMKSAGATVQTTTTGGALAIPFPRPFAAAPIVTATLISPSGFVVVRDGLTTTTGFGLLVFGTTGAAVVSGSCKVAWQAIPAS